MAGTADLDGRPLQHVELAWCEEVGRGAVTYCLGRGEEREVTLHIQQTLASKKCLACIGMTQGLIEYNKTLPVAGP